MQKVPLLLRRVRCTIKVFNKHAVFQGIIMKKILFISVIVLILLSPSDLFSGTVDPDTVTTGDSSQDSNPPKAGEVSKRRQKDAGRVAVCAAEQETENAQWRGIFRCPSSGCNINRMPYMVAPYSECRE